MKLQQQTVFIEQLTTSLFLFILFKMSTFNIYAQLKYIFLKPEYSILCNVLHWFIGYLYCSYIWLQQLTY
jgi:hypothetical protein